MTAQTSSCLSPAYFEELLGDLFSESWGKRLKQFTTGKDSGIDLRCLGLERPAEASCVLNTGYSFQTSSRAPLLPEVQPGKRTGN